MDETKAQGSADNSGSMALVTNISSGINISGLNQPYDDLKEVFKHTYTHNSDAKCLHLNCTSKVFIGVSNARSGRR